MNRHLFLIAASAVGLAACQSGDINIDPATNVSNSNNTNVTGGSGSANDVCASYLNTAGQKIQGVYDGTNCTYSPSFVDAGNNLKVDMTIPALPNGGAHIFEGSLFVGETYRTQAELATAGISEGGDGPKLTIEAGATLAFTSEKQFIIINRGSQIFAVGRADAPITFTSVSDIDGTVGPEDVQQWGGIVINGFGITNQCAYNGSITYNPDGSIATNTIALAGECSVDAEGSAGLDESQYGGDNNDDSSGRLEYVVVKHTGATVGNGDELNGISWGAVGRNTIVRTSKCTRCTTTAWSSSAAPSTSRTISRSTRATTRSISTKAIRARSRTRSSFSRRRTATTASRPTALATTRTAARRHSRGRGHPGHQQPPDDQESDLHHFAERCGDGDARSRRGLEIPRGPVPDDPQLHGHRLLRSQRPDLGQ